MFVSSLSSRNRKDNVGVKFTHLPGGGLFNLDQSSQKPPHQASVSRLSEDMATQRSDRERQERERRVEKKWRVGGGRRWVERGEKAAATLSHPHSHNG